MSTAQTWVDSSVTITKQIFERPILFSQKTPKQNENCRNFHQKTHLYLRLENMNPIKKFNKIIRYIYKKKNVNTWEKNPIIAWGNSILTFLDFFLFFFLKTKTFIFTYLRRISKPKFFGGKSWKKIFLWGNKFFFNKIIRSVFKIFIFFDQKNSPKLNYKVAYEVEKMTQKTHGIKIFAGPDGGGESSTLVHMTYKV